MSGDLRSIDALLPGASGAFGGKARNLAALARAGFPVPAAFVLSADAARACFRRVLPTGRDAHAVIADPNVSPDELAAFAERVRTAPLPPALAAELARAFDVLRAGGASSVAVRSSSCCEDLALASAAGLHDSVLHVRGHGALFDAVRACWASVFDPRVGTYLRAAGLEGGADIAVIIQAMVQAETAGVLFSAHPVTLDPGVMVVEAVYGLGAAVTDGAVTPDSYRIDKASGRLRDLVLGDKRWRITAPDGGPLREEALPAALASKRVLDEHTLARLVALGRRIEQHFGDPRDIEFALVDDGLYVLQARPITHAGKVRAVRPGARGRVSDPSGVVWSNVNVGEALPGVATPFTWSVLSEFAELGFREAFAALGCKVPKDAQLVGNFRGRIYLNLSELTAIAAQVPGLRPSAVLPLGGGAEVEQLERDLQPVSPAGWLLRLPRTVARYARAHVGFGRRLQRHRRAFDAEHARLSGLDLRILPGPSLDETLSDTGKLLDAAGTVMLTGYGGLLSTTVLLQTALRLTLGERAEQVGQALLSAVDEIDSADPGWALLHVAEQYGRDAAAAAALQAAAHDAHALPAGPGRAALASFVAEHGHRGVHEAEIAEPRWSEYPAVLFDLVRLQLGADPAATLRAREQRVATMRAERARVLAALPLAVRTGLAPLLPVIHRQLRERERLRSDVVRVLGLFRRVAIEASRRMRARESEVGIDAAFMLRRDELHAFLRGELRVLAPLVAKRRIQFERECAQPDPPATFVGQPPAIDRTPLGGKRLTGLAASAGRVEGMVRLVRGSEDLALLQPGEILVASSADVGLAPAFLVVGALVTDRGGVLSHACIVAREYGLPAVVNVAIATRALRTGDRVRVDGDAGTVDILQRA